MVHYLITMLYVHSVMSPKVACMEASNMDMKMDKARRFGREGRRKEKKKFQGGPDNPPPWRGAGYFNYPPPPEEPPCASFRTGDG